MIMHMTDEGKVSLRSARRASAFPIMDKSRLCNHRDWILMSEIRQNGLKSPIDFSDAVTATDECDSRCGTPSFCEQRGVQPLGLRLRRAHDQSKASLKLEDLRFL